MTGRGRSGFTLIEVLAVVILMALVLGVAISNYMNLSRASNRAAHHTRDIRRATALLDRVARDFEETVLVKKAPEVDPLAHPWLFYSESEFVEAGSDRIKFVTRHNRPRRSDAHESDLAMVAYTFEPAEDGETYQLWRWSTTQLPESLDRTFPRRDEEGSVLMAEGLSTFAVTFYGEEGEVQDTWDSTTLVESGELPLAVKITVAMADPDLPEDEDPISYSRRVTLPVRPLDLQVLLHGGQAAGANDDEDEDGDGEPDDEDAEDHVLTLGECVDRNAINALRGSVPGIDVLISIVSANANQPWQAWADSVPPELQQFVLPACR